MYLKKLELQGFKSFPDYTCIDFDRGLTAVVGPNGSGKSNISDAVRWVLGEQSVKQLRGGKMEDVIFNGTSARRSMNYAEVSITFDNSDGYIDYGFPEICITRRLYRSGESEYQINKVNCRLKDITVLFLDTGLGRDGYSLVGQGRVDDILSTKSEDRRRVIEEASGIVKYRVRKDEAQRKLNSTEQNLVRINDILGELEERKGPLEEQAGKARKFNENYEELKKLETSLLVHKITEANREMGDSAGLKEQLEKEIKRIKGIVKEPEKIKEAIIDEIKEIKQKYGYPRRSKILNLESDTDVNIGVVQILPDGTILFSETENPEHLSSDITPLAGDNVCLVDDKGYFLWVDTNKVLHDKPMTLTSIGKQQMGKCVAALSNPDNSVVLLSNRGRIKFIPITSIPTNATKKPLVPLDDDEYIVSVIEVRDASQDILVYTSDGMGKRVQISDLNLVKSVDAQGQFIVRNDAEVAGMFTINPNKQWLVYVTRLGRIRVNHAKFLNAAKKFGDLKPIIKLSQQDDLIAVFCTNKEQKITLNHADSRTTSVNIDSIEPTTMATPPVRPKHVPGVKVLRATIS